MYVGQKTKTEASYQIHEYEDGTCSAKTTTQWSRLIKKADLRTYYRNGEIYTQSKLRAWGKKYGLKIPESDISRLPKSV